MASISRYSPLLLLPVIALAPPLHAQDASFGIAQQTTNTEQNSSTTTEQTTTTTQGMDDGAGFGADTEQSSSSGSSHTETRSRGSDASISIGFDHDHDQDDDGWHHDRHHDRPDVDNRDLVGHWTLGQESGTTCTIELKDSDWFGGHGAYVPAGCPDGFFPANRWVMSGNQLLITDTNNQVIGRFRPSGGNRWSGRRESDGARLFLNPAGR